MKEKKIQTWASSYVKQKHPLVLIGLGLALSAIWVAKTTVSGVSNCYRLANQAVQVVLFFQGLLVLWNIYEFGKSFSFYQIASLARTVLQYITGY